MNEGKNILALEVECSSSKKLSISINLRLRTALVEVHENEEHVRSYAFEIGTCRYILNGLITAYFGTYLYDRSDLKSEVIDVVQDFTDELILRRFKIPVKEFEAAFEAIKKAMKELDNDRNKL